jgi:hypothetical protein
MSLVKFRQVTALPGTPEANTIYFIRGADSNLFEVVNVGSNPSEIRHIVNKADIAALIASNGGSAETLIDTTGVTANSGDIGPILANAINTADRGPGLPPAPLRLPAGRYRLRSNVTVSNKSIDLDATGAVFIQDPLHPVGDTSLNVVSTAGWPTTGTLTTYSTEDGSNFIVQNLSYTGVATGPTRFTGVSGWTGTVGTVMQGEVVTNGTQSTTANIAANVVSGNAIKFTVDLGAPLSVSAIGGVIQSGNIPELYVNSTAAFATSGTLSVPRIDGTIATVTYTGKTPYSFIGCSGMSGAANSGTVITDGTNNAVLMQTRYGYPGVSININGEQAANSTTLNIVNATALPSSGAIRVNSSTGPEIISYTSRTAVSISGCTGGTAAIISDGAVAIFEGNTTSGTRESYGTRIYVPTATLTVGDTIKVLSNDILNVASFNIFSTDMVEMQAEMGRIALVNTIEGYIVLDRELYLNYVSNPRLVKLDSDRTIRLRGLCTEYVNRSIKVGVNLGGFRGAYYIEGYIKPDFDNIGSRFFPGPNLSIRNCYEPIIGSVWGTDQAGSTSLNQVGYTLNLEAVTGGCAKYVHGERVRHVITTNANDNTRGVDTDPRNYGGVVDFHVETLVGVNNESFAWDTHSDAINMTGGRVVVRNDFQPRSEQMGAVQFRGFFGCGVDHIHYDGPGYALLVQGDIGAIDFYVNKITGRHQYTYRGGAGTTVRQGTTANGAQTLPSATFNVVSVAYLAPTGGTVLIHTTDNGPQTLTYTGITGNQLTGCTGGSGNVANAAIVTQVVNPEARLRIGSIDVVPTGGTSLLRHTRNGLLDIGEIRVRYSPSSFRPQSNLGHSVINFVTSSDPDNSRLRIGSMHLDLSGYPSAAAQPVAIYAMALDTAAVTQNYKYRNAFIDKLVVDFGTGYGNGPGNKFGVISGTGQSKDGDVIGELLIRQGGVQAGAFNPQFWVNGTANKSVKVKGSISGAGGSMVEFGDNVQSLSSATSSLHHSGPNYNLTSNTFSVSSPVLRARLNITNVAAKITSLQAPAFDGQVWKIACAITSANPLVVAAGQISNVGADLSIPAASEITLTASGGVWVKYTSA